MCTTLQNMGEHKNHSNTLSSLYGLPSIAFAAKSRGQVGVGSSAPFKKMIGSPNAREQRSGKASASQCNLESCKSKCGQRYVDTSC